MGTRGTPREPHVGVVGSLEVKPMFLARVFEATWQHADVKMHKLIRRSRDSHSLFHVCNLHGLELVFRDTW